MSKQTDKEIREKAHIRKFESEWNNICTTDDERKEYAEGLYLRVAHVEQRGTPQLWTLGIIAGFVLCMLVFSIAM